MSQYLTLHFLWVAFGVLFLPASSWARDYDDWMTTHRVTRLGQSTCVTASTIARIELGARPVEFLWCRTNEPITIALKEGYTGLVRVFPADSAWSHHHKELNFATLTGSGRQRVMRVHRAEFSRTKLDQIALRIVATPTPWRDVEQKRHVTSIPDKVKVLQAQYDALVELAENSTLVIDFQNRLEDIATLAVAAELLFGAGDLFHQSLDSLSVEQLDYGAKISKAKAKANRLTQKRALKADRVASIAKNGRTNAKPKRSCFYWAAPQPEQVEFVWSYRIRREGSWLWKWPNKGSGHFDLCVDAGYQWKLTLDVESKVDQTVLMAWGLQDEMYGLRPGANRYPDLAVYETNPPPVDALAQRRAEAAAGLGTLLRLGFGRRIKRSN